MSYGSFSLVRAAQIVVIPAVTHSFCFVALAPVASTFLKKTATITSDKTELLKFLMHGGEVSVGLGWCLTGIEGIVGISLIGCVNIYQDPSLHSSGV